MRHQPGLRPSRRRATPWAQALAAAVLLAAQPVAAQECAELPADPLRLAPFAEDLDQAYELSEKGFQAFENKDFRCAAYYNAEAFRYQPDPVLMQNAANALRQGQQLDAAERYAQHTLTLNPEQAEVDAAHAMIAELGPTLRSASYVEVSLRDYEAQAMVVGWTRYELGDRPRLPRGSLAALVERPGQPPVDETIAVPPPEPVVMAPVAAEPPSSWQWPAGLAVGGVGVALLGTALALDLVAGSKRDDYDRLRACLEVQRPCDDGRDKADYDALGDEITGLTNVELISLVSGGVLTAIGGGLLAWHFAVAPEDPGASQVSMTLAPTAGGGHVQVELRF